MPLRVALDHRPAVLGASGIGRAVRELTRALAKTGEIDLHLFGHSLAPARVPVSNVTGARLHRAPIPGRSLPWLARFGLDAAALAGRPALFHWTDYVHPPVRRVPVVLTVHDCAFADDPSFHGPDTDELWRRSRRAAARAARVIVPSSATAEAVVRALDVPAERVRVIPFGVDHVPQRTAPRPIAERYVVALGTIEPRKNHVRLLQAWRALPAPRPRLVVVGRRGWQCDDAVTALHVGRRDGVLTWHEQLADDAVFALLQHAEALAYPSLLEGFGFPPLEAMALGVPVVAGDTPALRETLGDAARFCDPRDPAAITEAMTAVLAGGEERARLVDRGRRRVAELTWRRCAEAHIASYREVWEGRVER